VQSFARGLTITLEATKPSDVVAFALPLARGAAARLEDLTVVVAGRAVSGARMRPLLFDLAPDGAHRGLRSVWIELPRGALARLPATVDVRFAPSGQAAPAAPKPSTLSFAAASHPVRVTIPTAKYDVESRGASSWAAVPKERADKLLFESVEPSVVATFPAGYLADTGIFGDLMPRKTLESRSDLAGVRFLSDAIVHYADGAMGFTGYPVHPAAVGFETEAWLYDRCATYLLAYAHAGETRHLRHGLATCAAYARAIGREGERRGIFAGKKERDTKYSHARGLYLYYAMTGDDAALEAGRAIADMWESDPLFVLPYRAGSVRGIDKLWTERLLAASIEGGTYGFLLTGDARFLASARGLVKTALRHVTTANAAELRAIIKSPFPPQSCFVHNALQQAEGNDDEPWCSSWMSELVVDPLLRFEAITGEHDVEQIFVRLARSMRDVGTTYFHDNPIGDSFLAPRAGPFTGDPRVLTPLYGYGIAADGRRVPNGEWSDFEHCPDATAITAVALRALRRTGLWDSKPIPASSVHPVDLSRFASEGESILALHKELTFCAAEALTRARREGRDPRSASQSVLSSAYGAGDAAARARAMESQKIGWPVYETSPGRKLSWWFNTSIAELSWLAEAHVVLSEPRSL
jgi:hypothetical protein